MVAVMVDKPAGVTTERLLVMLQQQMEGGQEKSKEPEGFRRPESYGHRCFLDQSPLLPMLQLTGLTNAHIKTIGRIKLFIMRS